MKAAFHLPGAMREWAAFGHRLPTRSTFDFRGTSLDVAATSDRAIATLRRVCRYFLRTRDDVGGVSGDFLLVIEEGTAEAAAFSAALGRNPLSFDGHLLVASWLTWGLRIADHTLLHYYASKLLRLRVAERWYPDIITLHAASLCSPDGGGLLLLGEAAAGKTTLTLRLLEDGFRYCSDDTTCIRCSDVTCLPFPMAFIVRGDLATGVPSSPELRQRPPDLSLLDEPRWLAERWDAVGMPFQPEVLYFVAADPARPAGEIRPMRQADAALALLRNLVMPLGADAGDFTIGLSNMEVCCRIAESCRCMTVNTADLDRGHGVILADYLDHARPRIQVAS